MKLVVITQPAILPGEAKITTSLFRSGLQVLHVRKPEATEAQLTRLLEELPSEYHDRIMLHQHHGLAQQFSVKVHASLRRLQSLHGGMEPCFLTRIMSQSAQACMH